MSKKGKPTNNKRPKRQTTADQEAPQPSRRKARDSKPPKYNHPSYWISEEANLQ
jgi:hypothetical protein